MNKYTDFPEQPRVMTDPEGESYFNNMTARISDWKPDEIIAVARSGFSYASWVAQQLRLPLGAYWHESRHLVCLPTSRRIVFVDDNIVSGRTAHEIAHWMELNRPDIQFKIAVLFTDYHTPATVDDAVIAGRHRLPYFAEEPTWGSKKISAAYGVRYRD